jgi:hypothetical protein
MNMDALFWIRRKLFKDKTQKLLKCNPDTAMTAFGKYCTPWYKAMSAMTNFCLTSSLFQVNIFRRLDSVLKLLFLDPKNGKNITIKCPELIVTIHLPNIKQ